MATKTQSGTDKNVTSTPTARPRASAPPTRIPFGDVMRLEGRVWLTWRHKRVIAASLAVHVLVALVMVLMPSGKKDDAPDPIDIVFYPKEQAPVEIPLPEPEPEPVILPEPEPEIARVEPEPEPLVAEVRPEPPRPAPEPRRQPIRTPEPPKPKAKPKPRPQVKTNVFAQAEPAPEPKAQPRRTQTGSFTEQAAVERKRDRPREAKVGGFASDTAESKPRQPKRVVAGVGFADGSMTVARERGSERQVSSVSFGDDAAPVTTAKRNRSTTTKELFDSSQAERAIGTPRGGNVQSAGFTDGPADAPSRGARGAVRDGGFNDEVVASKSSGRQRPAAKLDTPVEVMSKVTPVYTEEAKRLGVEGEVVLEVIFKANGKLDILRVVDGLGHGLDEAAVAAARKMTFTPARRGGTAVDYTATVRVVFQLA